MIFNYEKEWVLKKEWVLIKEFQIWFLIMKRKGFDKRISDPYYLVTNNHRSKIISWKTLNLYVLTYELNNHKKSY